MSAARPLLPVRSTLVAPILPEPICAQIAEPGELGEDESEGDGTEQIAEPEAKKQRMEQGSAYSQASEGGIDHPSLQTTALRP